MSLEIRYNEEDSLYAVCTWGLREAAGVRGRIRKIFDLSECLRMYMAKSVGFHQEEDKMSRRILLEAKDRRGPGAANGQERYRRCYPRPLWHEEDLCFIGLLICSACGISLGPLPATLQTAGEPLSNAPFLLARILCSWLKTTAPVQHLLLLVEWDGQ